MQTASIPQSLICVRILKGTVIVSTCLTGMSAFFALLIVWKAYRHETCPDPKYPNLLYDGGDHFTNGCYGNDGRIEPVIEPIDSAFTTVIVALCLIGAFIISGILWCVVENREIKANTLNSPQEVNPTIVTESSLETVELESVRVDNNNDMKDQILQQEQASDTL